MTTNFSDLPQKHFACIAADVPSHFKTFSKKGLEGRPQHYKRMSKAELMALPVGDLAAKDCYLFYWTSAPWLKDAFEIIEAWGFKYSSVAFDWIKTNPKAPLMFTGINDWHMGQGYTTRKNAEYCLLATRGKPQRQSKEIRALLISPRLRRSEKPPEFYSRVEKYCLGPRLDLFSRQDRENWFSFGDEAGRFNRAAE